MQVSTLEKGLKQEWEAARTECREGLIRRVVSQGKPSCSVVIPAYNLRAVIGDAIESVAQQTAKADEIIVCDDGSTDGTGEYAESLGATVLFGPKANGNVARNRGLRRAKGDIVLLLDGDDWWHPGKVEAHLLAHAAEPTASFIYDPAVVVQSGAVVGRTIGEYGDQRPSWDRFLDWKCWASGSSFSIDRRRLLQANDFCFNERLIALQDVDFWVRATYQFGAAYRLQAPFTYYRITPRTVSRSPKNVAVNLECALESWPFLSEPQRSDFRRQTFLTAARFCNVPNGMGYLKMAGWPLGKLKFWKSLAHMIMNSGLKQY